MRKKLYMMVLCAALLVNGCGNVQEAVSDDITVTEAPEEAEVNLHPIQAEGIDYLSVEGISLEAGTEIAMVASDAGNTFYEMVKKGAEQAVADLNAAHGYSGKKKITLSYTAPKKESAIDQINIIDQFLDKAPDALCIAFTDASACKTQLEMAKNNGIRLIAFDAPDESNITEAAVSTNNAESATLAAKQLFEKLEEGSKIAIIAHNSIKHTGTERYRAITSAYTKDYAEKNFRFVEVVYIVQDERTEKEIFDELLQNHPDLAGVICTDKVTTESAIDYAKSMEEQSFLIAGYDAGEKIVAAIEDGTVLGVTSQDPYGMGYATVVAAARAVAGMENAETIYSDHLWIDAVNLDSEEAVSLFAW